MRQSIKIFKAKSRLGIYNPHNNDESTVIGLESGPDELLQKGENVYSYTFPLPNEVEQPGYLEVMFDHTKNLKDLILDNSDKQDMQIVVGGDHSIGLASVAAVLEKYGVENTGFLQIDSHTDIHQPSTSPSGNFHGMWLRAVCDAFEDKKIDSLVPQKLQTNHMMFTGNFDLEEAEWDFIHDHNITTIPSNTVEESVESIVAFVKSFAHVHVSFDIDAMDESIAPGTGLPARKGLSKGQLFIILDIVKKNQPSFSFDLVEVNPTRDKEGKTVELAREILNFMMMNS